MKYTLEARVTKETLERHTAIFGASGGGKSVLLSNMALSVIRSTATSKGSVVIIEPHSSIAPLLMTARALDTDRLVYISTEIQKEAQWNGNKITPGFNPFQLPKDADESFKNLLAAQLAHTIAEMVDTGQYGITINMHMLLLPAILVALSSDNPCMNTLKRVLENTDENLQQIGFNYPHPQIADFFRNHFGNKDYDITRRALISKINYILNDMALYDILNSDGIDIEDCLNSGKVLIINTPTGENPFVASILPRLMIAYIFSLVLRRSEEQRKVPVYMFVDELNSYANSSSLVEALHQARKFGLRLIISGQTCKGLPQPMKVALMTNTYMKLVTISDAETRTLLSKEMGVSADELSSLEPLMFMLSRNDGKTKPIRIKATILSKQLFLTKKERVERLRYLIQNSGVYKEVPPPPASSPYQPPVKESKKKGNNNDDKPFHGLKPSFT
ncbi:MAG TPA: type IV secretion system DNA-binding domain-containing protein [Flavipsychrobacter sp.]